MQFVLVEFLDAGLADMVGTGIGHRVELLQLGLVDPPDVTDRVGEMLAHRVMADELRRHIHARQAVLVHRDTGDLLLGQLEHDRHRLERPAPLLHALLEDRPVFLGQTKDFHQGLHHLFEVLGALAGDGQTEAWPVIGDDHPISVEDQPTARRNRLHVHTVVLGQRRVVVVLRDLQVVHARHQHQREKDDGHRADDDPAANLSRVLLVVFQLDRLRHLRGTTRDYL
ncbi:hypothetical protein D3C78_1125320 [compost metagenome]